jgi:Kef-type K+ transport system membrane component KefB
VVEPDLVSIALVACAAAVATIVSRLSSRLILPTVVVEIALGILIGPDVLDLAKTDPYLEFLSGFGLAYLFFLAGIEVIHSAVPTRLLTRGSLGWGISIALGAAAGFALEAAGVPASGWLLAVALATTALGTLVPILSDAGVLPSPLGQNTLGAAVAGEFWPIVVISLFLTGAHATTASIVLLFAFGVVVASAAGFALHFRPPRLIEMARETVNKSGQLAVRLSIALLALLVLFADKLDFDFVLGAFAAGLIIGLVTEGETGEQVLPRITTIGYGLLIPIFFIATGMDFDLDGLLTGTGLMLGGVFLGLLLVTRGAAALLSARDLGARRTVALALFSATGLPLIVAVIEVGEERGEISSDVAAALVGAGMASVLIYPLLGLLVTRASREQAVVAEDA